MRTSTLISSTGTFINSSDFIYIPASPLNGVAGFSLFLNQITLEFYTGVITNSNGLISPDPSTVVTSGLTGTVQIKVWGSENSPYPIGLSSDSIDISNSCMLQWTGITEKLDVICTSIVGASYINILLDRN